MANNVRQLATRPRSTAKSKGESPDANKGLVITHKNPIASMGWYTVYLPTLTIKLQPNVGKCRYIPHMDGTGMTQGTFMYTPWKEQQVCPWKWMLGILIRFLFGIFLAFFYLPCRQLTNPTLGKRKEIFRSASEEKLVRGYFALGRWKGIYETNGP